MTDNTTPTPETDCPGWVRGIREAHGWTLREAAERAGVALRTWQHWEQPEGQDGHRKPRGAALKFLREIEAEAYRRGKGP